jgi:integrase
MSLKAARALAARTKAMVDEGLNITEVRRGLEAKEQTRHTGHSDNHDTVPQKARRPRKLQPAVPQSNAILLKDAAKTWFNRKSATLSNGKHIDQNWNTLNTYILPKLGGRDISSIRRKEIIEALSPLWHSKHTTAKRTLGRLREVIELARLEHDLDFNNPALFCTKTAFGYHSEKTKHHAASPPAQLPEFWAWLENVECEEVIRLGAQLMVLTAKRTGETRFAEWSFFSIPQKVWGTPEHIMKMRIRHRVPLSRQALRILENAALLSAGKRMVFAKTRTRSGTFCENAILNLVKRFDPNLTAHGFRASFKTWARMERRYSFDAIEFALAHVPTKLEAAYMREDLLEERAELMQDWADFVTGGKEPASLKDQIDLEQ